MGDTRWRAADPATLRRAALGDLTALYHRPSGQTHVVAEPVPQILQALTGGPLTVAELMAALASSHDLEGDEAGLRARLAELAEAGLVSVI